MSILFQQKIFFLGIMDLHFVFFIMQNYPFRREWNKADWMDPLVSNS